jgi:hypothetical protein
MRSGTLCALVVVAWTWFMGSATAQNMESPLSVDTVGELRYNCLVHNRVLEGRILDDADGLRTATCPSFIVGVVTGVQLQAYGTRTRPLFCPPGNLGIGQEVQVFLNWASAHPEAWNDRAATGVGRAMIERFPCQ